MFAKEQTNKMVIKSFNPAILCSAVQFVDVSLLWSTYPSCLYTHPATFVNLRHLRAKPIRIASRNKHTILSMKNHKSQSVRHTSNDSLTVMMGNSENSSQTCMFCVTIWYPFNRSQIKKTKKTQQTKQPPRPSSTANTSFGGGSKTGVCSRRRSWKLGIYCR